MLPYLILQRPDYRPSTLHRRIANALERVEAGLVRRLMIFVPPRHGKSMLVSNAFPAWYLGRNPGHSIICASYAQELADDFGRQVRNQLTDERWPLLFPDCQIAGDAAAVSRIATEAHGAYYAVGVGASTTGRGAHVLLIDDPIKSREDAESETYRRKLREWYQSVAYTRLMGSGAIVVMHTRWHEDDLAGWLLREHAHEGWEVISIPALDEHGNAAWPEAFPPERLDEIRRAIGPREWAALYQQSPRPPGGGEFRREWFCYYERTPAEVADGLNIYMLVDPAGEQRPGNDYTSIAIVGAGGDGNLYLLDLVRDRLNLTQRGDEVLRLHRRWRPLQVRYERYGMQADVQYLRARMEHESYRFTVLEVGGTRLKKEDRIRRLVPWFEQRKVYFPRTLAYVDREGLTFDMVTELERELLTFPAGVHDDMIDSLARIAEPDHPLTWPTPEVEERPRDRYARDRYDTRRVSAWAS